MSCDNGTHSKVVFDRFQAISGVRRSVPGDCYCLDCKQPIPANWNDGNPVSVKQDPILWCNSDTEPERPA